MSVRLTELELPVAAPPQVPPRPAVTSPLPAVASRLRPRVDHVRVAAEAGRTVLVWFALLVVYTGHRPLTQAGVLAVTLAAGIWLMALKCTVMPSRAVLGRAVGDGVGTTVGLVVVAALNSSTVGLGVSRATLVGSGLAVFSSVACWGWFVDRALASRRRVLVVGTEDVSELLSDELNACRRPRYDVVGAVPGAQELAEIVEAQRPDIVVLTDETTYGPALERLLDARANVRVAGFESFFEYAFGRVPIDQITPAWFMSLLHPRQRMYTRFAKRTFDVVVAFVLLLLGAPLIALAALATKLGGGGPVIYKQVRLGEGGKRFTIHKFRTMRCDAESEGPALWQTGDPRVTRVGRILRRTHVDELPQLWNVLQGNMSVVGPRPERPEFIAQIEAAVPFWNRRILVKPGITGWAQVRCGYASDCEDMETKLSYDLWYLRHGSMLVDLAVCVMTLCTVIGRPARP